MRRYVRKQNEDYFIRRELELTVKYNTIKDGYNSYSK